LLPLVPHHIGRHAVVNLVPGLLCRLLTLPVPDAASYPPESYAPGGTLWWQLETWPGSKRRFGDEPKIAAYLFYLGVGAGFTMRSLRAALGDETIPNDAEHLNRRMRQLRLRDGWAIPSARDEAVGVDEYRIRKIGWHPGTGLPRPKNTAPSAVTRRKVFERDRRVCQICFTPGGEPYPDMPDRKARLTLGHRIPDKRADSSATVDELQTECAYCNETVRDELFDPVTLEQLRPGVRSLKRVEKAQLLKWLKDGRRTPRRVEDVYFSTLRLRPSERDDLIAELRAATGDGS
jgi:5-methylcytosine-specific restriction endonuclease McrA